LVPIKDILTVEDYHYVHSKWEADHDAFITQDDKREKIPTEEMEILIREATVFEVTKADSPVVIIDKKNDIYGAGKRKKKGDSKKKKRRKKTAESNFLLF